MKSFKSPFFLLLLLFGQYCIAQDSGIKDEVKKIEHLLEYNQYKKVEKKTDSLLPLFENRYKDEKFLESKLRLLLVKGRMYETKEENNKALKPLLTVVDLAESNKLYAIACHTNIMLALIYEKQSTPKLAKQYLDQANRIRIKHNLQEFYSTILMRRSLYHRWFTKNIDSAMYYSKKALDFAQKHHNEYDITEASMMIGLYEGEQNRFLEGIKYYQTAAKYYLKTNNYNYTSLMYDNIASHYFKAGFRDKALTYSDTAYDIVKKASVIYQRHITETRAGAFAGLKQMDSAFFYLNKARKLREVEIKDEETATIKTITEQYENDKKEATIQNKNQQMILIGSLLGVIVIATFLLFRKNRQINSQNKIIRRQLMELSKTLEQKQVLLSELQHRVKNNLQHVISILEIQKESVDFNNIDELIRGNQNRIHSMALLHKKLNVSDNVNDVDLKRYITELSELVKESYHTNNKNITLKIICEADTLSIEKALPLGLIIVELVSNSMKHAFKKRSIGIINIEITNDGTVNQLYYSDNGTGFDFTKTSKKGLGQEIIKGLIDQLDGDIKTKSDNGFELNVYFK